MTCIHTYTGTHLSTLPYTHKYTPIQTAERYKERQYTHTQRKTHRQRRKEIQHIHKKKERKTQKERNNTHTYTKKETMYITHIHRKTTYIQSNTYIHAYTR